MKIALTGWFQSFLSGAPARRAFIQRIAAELVRRGARLDALDLSPVLEPMALPEGCRHFYLGSPSALPYNGPRWDSGRKVHYWKPPGLIGGVRTAAGIAISCHRFARYLREERPAVVVNYNAAITIHRLFNHLIVRAGLPRLLTHMGIVPGTLEISPAHFQATSWPVRHFPFFRTLETPSADIEKMRRYLDAVAAAWEPSPSEVADLRSRIQRESDRPVVLLIGSGEFGNGIWPRWETESRIHSPFYRRDTDLLPALLEMARRNEWLIVFRPHPENALRKAIVHPNLVPVDSLNRAALPAYIRASDATMTLVSSASNMSLMLGRPCVLVGRNAMSGMGAAYEVGAVGQIESRVRDALAGGVTPEMADNWLRGAARLSRYYYFSESALAQEHLGRGPEQAALHLLEYAGAGPAV